MNQYPPPPVKPNKTGWIVTILLLCLFGLPGAGLCGLFVGYALSQPRIEELQTKAGELQAQLDELRNPEPKRVWETSKITGRAGLRTDSGVPVFSGNLYNGTNDALGAVVVEIVLKDSTKKEIATRQYRAEVDIAPQATGPFSVNIMDEGQEVDKAEWSIKEAYTRVPNSTGQ